MRERPLADRLAGALSACRGIEAVAEAVCTSIQADVPFAFGCFATTDPLTGMITWAFKTHPLEFGDEQFTAVEYGRPDINLFADIAQRPEPVGVLSIDTAGRPDTCHRFREFLAPQFAFTDELRAVFRAQHLTWGLLALYRGAGDRPFTAEDARTLCSVCEVVAGTIRQTLFAAYSPDPHAAAEPAVIIVDSQGRVREMTRTARRRIEDLGGWDNGSLPTSVLAVAASARAVPELAMIRARVRTGEWLTLRATALDGLAGDGNVVVTIGVAPRAEMSRLTLAARGLTGREQEVAVLVLQGASTRSIAAALYLSPHTVQDHLKAIFTKLGVNSRREMIARLVLD